MCVSKDMRVTEREEEAAYLSVIEESVEFPIVRRMSVEPQFSPHPDFGALFRPAFLQRGIVGQNTQDLVAVVNIESDLRGDPRLDPDVL